MTLALVHVSVLTSCAARDPAGGMVAVLQGRRGSRADGRVWSELGTHALRRVETSSIGAEGYAYIGRRHDTHLGERDAARRQRNGSRLVEAQLGIGAVPLVGGSGTRRGPATRSRGRACERLDSGLEAGYLVSSHDQNVLLSSR